MNEDVKAAIDEIANAMQVINLLSTRLRQDLGECATRDRSRRGNSPCCSRDEAPAAGRKEEALAAKNPSRRQL